MVTHRRVTAMFSPASVSSSVVPSGTSLALSTTLGTTARRYAHLSRVDYTGTMVLFAILVW